jgi:hypothetical protein
MGEIFNAPITDTTTIWEDNQSAIAYSQNAPVNEDETHRSKVALPEGPLGTWDNQVMISP